MSFVARQITLTFALNDGTNFAGTSSSVITVLGLRVFATITKAGGAGMTQTSLRVFGLSPQLMRQLSTYGAPINSATAATVQVSAGDAVAGMSVIATGTIRTAEADYNQAPEVAFNVQAFTGILDAVKPIRPTSINGSADAAQIMATLAKTMGYQFENNGVSVQLDHPYFSGTARMQAQECADAGNFAWIIDNDTLIIWKRNGYRAGTPVLVSPETGMVGYPTFIYQGVTVRMLLNANIKYGTRIQVQSSLQPACGLWAINQMVYELESETPNGAWFLTVVAYSPNVVQSANISAAP